MSGFGRIHHGKPRFFGADWDEEKHPRDGGKFAPKEGDGKKEDDPPDSGFVPAKNAAAAEAWAKANLITEVGSYKGVHTATANAVNETLLEFEFRTGGSVPSKIEFGGVARGHYAAHNFETKTIHLRKNMSRLGEQEAKDNERWSSRYNGVPYHASEGIRGLLFHEIAHAVDEESGRMKSKRIELMPLEERRKMLKVSGYSGEDFSIPNPFTRVKNAETWAEAFAAVATDSPQAKHVPELVRDMVGSILK